jgi:hypothetical protein
MSVNNNLLFEILSSVYDSIIDLYSEVYHPT